MVEKRELDSRVHNLYYCSLQGCYLLFRVKSCLDEMVCKMKEQRLELVPR